jgi:hypothetical protein
MSPNDHGEYFLAHNGYLRLVLFLGWIVAFLMLYVLLAIIIKIKFIGGHMIRSDSIPRTYGNAVAASFVSLFVQAVFHNASLFTIEKTNWIIFVLVLLWHHYALSESAQARLNATPNEL